MVTRLILAQFVFVVTILAMAISRQDVEKELLNDIQKHKVMVFSKTYCPYSRRLKALLATYKIADMKIMELDLQKDMSDRQEFLKTLSGRRTVPQLFINGTFIGGSDDTREKEKTGEFRRILREAGALLDDPQPLAKEQLKAEAATVVEHLQ